jgi:hypothetical protein
MPELQSYSTKLMDENLVSNWGNVNDGYRYRYCKIIAYSFEELSVLVETRKKDIITLFKDICYGINTPMIKAVPKNVEEEVII